MNARMIQLFNEIKILKAYIDRKTKVDLILEIWSDFFRKFELNYFIYEWLRNLLELMRELQMHDRGGS